MDKLKYIKIGNKRFEILSPPLRPVMIYHGKGYKNPNLESSNKTEKKEIERIYTPNLKFLIHADNIYKTIESDDDYRNYEVNYVENGKLIPTQINPKRYFWCHMLGNPFGFESSAEVIYLI
jgi:hypothetical protein